MSIKDWGWATVILAASACSNGGAAAVQPTTTELNRTGLEGTAWRGPIQPVCHEGQPCDAPVQAGFTLQQQGRVVSHFMSDAAGHFLVYAPPGNYLAVPDRIIGFGPQSVAVTVQAEGLTHCDLSFDTGIR